jgi:hypothetical protein
MEDVLDVYARPYDSEFPVICMDESNKQLLGEVTPPIPVAPGRPLLRDDEYIRHGVANIFMEVEPLAGRRHVEITHTRTRLDWAWFVAEMADNRYPYAKKIVLVMDNLNTHNIASLYETFPPEKARRIAEKLEIHHTPKHGSWLNVAEIELSVLKRQCLDRRIDSIEKMSSEVAAWESDRNYKQTQVKWHFTSKDARCKLSRLYPKL